MKSPLVSSQETQNGSAIDLTCWLKHLLYSKAMEDFETKARESFTSGSVVEFDGFLWSEWQSCIPWGYWYAGGRQLAPLQCMHRHCPRTIRSSRASCILSGIMNSIPIMKAGTSGGGMSRGNPNNDNVMKKINEMRLHTWPRCVSLAPSINAVLSIVTPRTVLWDGAEMSPSPRGTWANSWDDHWAVFSKKKPLQPKSLYLKWT